MKGKSGEAGPRRPRPTPGSSRGCASAGTPSRRSARPPRRASWPTASWRRCSPRRRGEHTVDGGGGGDRPRARADRALLDDDGPARPDAGVPHRRGRAGPSVRRLGALVGLPAGGVPPARARVWAGAGPDRRRRGAAVPHLRPRAADARGRARHPDGGGDGAPRARPAAAHLAADGLRAPALPPALHRAGRGGPHGGRDGRGHRPRPAARGDRVLRPGRLHALHRGGGRGGGAVVRGAVRGGRDRPRCPTTRA